MLGVLFWTLAAASGGRRLPNVALLAVGSLFFLKMCLKPLTILTINPQKVNSQQKPLDYLTINFFDKTNVLKVKVFWFRFDFGQCFDFGNRNQKYWPKSNWNQTEIKPPRVNSQLKQLWGHDSGHFWVGPGSDRNQKLSEIKISARELIVNQKTSVWLQSRWLLTPFLKLIVTKWVNSHGL